MIDTGGKWQEKELQSMPCTNAKFAITTKSGHSEIKEFSNYAEAQRYAKQKFGLGCIVQVVGNCGVSSNPVVNAALGIMD